MPIAATCGVSMHADVRIAAAPRCGHRDRGSRRGAQQGPCSLDSPLRSATSRRGSSCSRRRGWSGRDGARAAIGVVAARTVEASRAVRVSRRGRSRRGSRRSASSRRGRRGGLAAVAGGGEAWLASCGLRRRGAGGRGGACSWDASWGGRSPKRCSPRLRVAARTGVVAAGSVDERLATRPAVITITRATITIAVPERSRDHEARGDRGPAEVALLALDRLPPASAASGPRPLGLAAPRPRGSRGGSASITFLSGSIAGR